MDGTSCTATLTVDSAEWLIVRMLPLDADWSVREPEEVRTRCRQWTAHHVEPPDA